jgi:CBS domain-containing protein
MARTVREIMNPHLLSIHSAEPADETLDRILEFGITAVPVLDEDGRPVGVTSLRDLVRVGAQKAPVTSPATAVALHASVASAAETMATTGRHHLVVVDASGRAVGMVSTLDVIRALVGYPVKHPSSFLGQDPDLGVWWSSDEVFEPSSMASLPKQPGVFLLVRGGVDRSEDCVWAEATTNVRTRATELLSERPRNDPPRLEEILRVPNLRVRYAIIRDETEQRTLVRRLRERMDLAPPPGGT